MIPAEQVERRIVEAVQRATHAATAPLHDALTQAKHTIAQLRAALYGVRAETYPSGGCLPLITQAC